MFAVDCYSLIIERPRVRSGSPPKAGVKTESLLRGKQRSCDKHRAFCKTRGGSCLLLPLEINNNIVWYLYIMKLDRLCSASDIVHAEELGVQNGVAFHPWGHVEESHNWEEQDDCEDDGDPDVWLTHGYLSLHIINEFVCCDLPWEWICPHRRYVQLQ